MGDLFAQRLELEVDSPARPVPPSWWQEFLRICLRELPDYGVPMCVEQLGMDTDEVQALCALSDADFETYLATVDD